MESIKNNIPMSINNKQLQKMLFIFNAIEDGWYVKKKNKNYIFSKKHEGKKEVFSEDFLKKFIEKNLNFSRINE